MCIRDSFCSLRCKISRLCPELKLIFFTSRDRASSLCQPILGSGHIFELHFRVRPPGQKLLMPYPLGMCWKKVTRARTWNVLEKRCTVSESPSFMDVRVHIRISKHQRDDLLCGLPVLKIVSKNNFFFSLFSSFPRKNARFNMSNRESRCTLRGQQPSGCIIQQDSIQSTLFLFALYTHILD